MKLLQIKKLFQLTLADIAKEAVAITTMLMEVALLWPVIGINGLKTMQKDALMILIINLQMDKVNNFAARQRFLMWLKVNADSVEAVAETIPFLQALLEMTMVWVHHGGTFMMTNALENQEIDVQLKAQNYAAKLNRFAHSV